MPTAKPSDPQSKKDRVMKERMDAWKSGDMHPGTGVKGEKKAALGPKDYKQAVAISLSMSGQSKKSKRSSKRVSGRR